ncbi:MAG: hypothetical protein GY846_08310 [Deltaproteobacteria bacterium]|nr:hypothetical protein [Deltaproteobacteria bacterium]
MKPEIALFTSLAGEVGTINAGMFIKASDLPKGWWAVKGRKATGSKKPQMLRPATPNAVSIWFQRFPVSDGKGYKFNKGSRNDYYREVNKKTSSGKVKKQKRYDLPNCSVRIWIENRFLVYDKPSPPYDLGRESINTYVQKNGYHYIGKRKKAIIKRKKDGVDIIFLRGMYLVTVRIASIRPSNKKIKPDIPKYERLARILAKKIVSRMSGAIVGRK